MPYTAIYRTNSKILEEAFKALQAGKSVSVVGGVKTLCDNLIGLYDLVILGKRPRATCDYSRFKSKAEISLEAQSDRTLARDINIIRNLGSSVVPMCSTLRDKASTRTTNADIIMVTAHNSKGLEWPQVVVGDDFKFEKDDNVEAGNALYVAVTRAQKALSVPSDLFREGCWGGDCGEE